MPRRLRSVAAISCRSAEARQRRSEMREGSDSRPAVLVEVAFIVDQATRHPLMKVSTSASSNNTTRLLTLCR
jgi:hypothetical protein